MILKYWAAVLLLSLCAAQYDDTTLSNDLTTLSNELTTFGESTTLGTGEVIETTTINLDDPWPVMVHSNPVIVPVNISAIPGSDRNLESDGSGNSLEVSPHSFPDFFPYSGSNVPILRSLPSIPYSGVEPILRTATHTVPFGVLQDSNGLNAKKRCRCIEKKHRKVVKEIKFIPLKPSIELQHRNFTCKCSHLRRVNRDRVGNGTAVGIRLRTTSTTTTWN